MQVVALEAELEWVQRTMEEKAGDLSEGLFGFFFPFLDVAIFFFFRFI